MALLPGRSGDLPVRAWIQNRSDMSDSSGRGERNVKGAGSLRKATGPTAALPRVTNAMELTLGIHQPYRHSACVINLANEMQTRPRAGKAHGEMFVYLRADSGGEGSSERGSNNSGHSIS